MIELYHELEKYTDASCLKSILKEHPEVEILWDCRENFQKPLVVNGEDPLLHVLFEAIIEKQIQAGEPLKVRQALERMLELGFPRPVARGAIVKLFRWYLDSANQGSDTTDADAAGTGGYLQKLNFLGINPDKIERNQPCPCLSGKKFKKCCLPLSKLLEINSTEGELHLGASAYFNPHFKDAKENSIYIEIENRSHFARFLESTGELETALLYLQENVRVTENKPHQFQENALKELLFFCTQHLEFANLGLTTAERLINLPGVDSAEIDRCRCDQADLLAGVHGLTRGTEAYDLLKQEKPDYHYADFRRADLLHRFGQTEAALDLLREIETHGDSVEPEVRTAVTELLRKIKPL